MYIKYNNVLYDSISDEEGLYLITRNEGKAQSDFQRSKRSYYKIISSLDSKIEDIYEVDFYAYYMDGSETLKQAGADGIWWVNEGKPIHRAPVLEENELGLALLRGSLSKDWIPDDKCSCSKIVDLYECSDYTVVYTYTYKDGKSLAEKEVVEVKMDAEAFKAEMLKYRRENI